MKRKGIAILNVLAWGLFWIFGFIAVTSPELGERQIVIAVLLSGVGFLVGILTYLKLSKPVRPVRASV
ncbi:hypothetical protein [Pseudooceanicola sp. HF7]|uniref:hypothetical protein n=1 Tax=Pseudooceanicola sp. HF7 TaxID=2721560 RepID=UPI00143070A6|nr:hypothetical protein [Pseudooceanicola sp. HF7]NIZ11476.1 hypothetical protein [Pseudooceanicola sp. HF7]